MASEVWIGVLRECCAAMVCGCDDDGDDGDDEDDGDDGVCAR